MATKRKAVRRVSTESHGALRSAGFEHSWQLLLNTPVRYDEPDEPFDLANCKKTQGIGVATFVAEVLTPAEQKSLFPALATLRLKGSDGQVIEAIFDGLLDTQLNLCKADAGSFVLISGCLTKDGQCLYNASLDVTRPLKAQYKGKTRGVNKDLPDIVENVFFSELSLVEKTIKQALDPLQNMEILEYLNSGIVLPKFTSIKQWLMSLHFPFSQEEASRAQWAAKNLAALDCCVRAKKASYKPEDVRSVISIDPKLVSSLLEKLPFKITIEQRTAMVDIWRDLGKPMAMNRILSGDVGTGKTAVMGVLAAAAQLSGKRVVVFTPNGLLADQFFSEMRGWFPELPIYKVTASDKPHPGVLSKLPILIGTHAVISWAKNNQFFPDWLLVDEQQKSSRAQREELLLPHTNLLEATATCLPRTFGLMLYGGMKISVIKQQPVVKKLLTKVVYKEDNSAIFAEIRAVVKAGDKVAVILPLVNAKGDQDEVTPEQEKLAVESAIDYWEAAFPGRVIGLHGKMSDDDKLSKLTAISTRTDKSIVVATTLIEIGVTIKNLRHLLVVEADRYGLSTLHQMRGRLARNGGKGTMHLLLKKDAKDLAEKTLQRLSVIEKTTCGFELAEADAKLRGWGDLAQDSSLQSGAVTTILRNILIPHETIASIQNEFEKNDRTFTV